jgi:hypothetical protein
MNINDLTPEERFYQLEDALKACSVGQDVGNEPIFTIAERILINQERGRILAGDNSYQQSKKIEDKIQKISKKQTIKIT